MARATSRGSARSSTGGCDTSSDALEPAHVIRRLLVGELETVGRRHDHTALVERMTLRSTSFRSAASATPVCGQLNMPVRSARAASSAAPARGLLHDAVEALERADRRA
jgi:hypothetical protein